MPSVVLTLYVDASFLPEIREGFGCLIWDATDGLPGQNEPHFMALGSLRDSMNAEYLTLARALRYLCDKAIVGVSLKKIRLQVWTDNQGLYEVLNKLQTPPAQTTLANYIREIRGMFKRYECAQVGRVNRKNNLAGLALDRWVAEYKRSPEYACKLNKMQLLQQHRTERARKRRSLKRRRFKKH